MRLALPREPHVATVVGLIPLVPYALMAAVFMATYVINVSVAVVSMAGSIVRGHGDPVKCLNALFAWSVNAPIAFLTLTPLAPDMARSAEAVWSVRHPRAQRREREAPVEVLPPAAPGKTRVEDTPFFWEVLQRLASSPGGVPDIVSVMGTGEPRNVGRHAKSCQTETEDRVTVGA